MKKILALFCSAVVAVGMGAGVVTASAEDEYVGPNYFNDFQSYKTVEEDGYDPMQMKDEWGNGWFDGLDDASRDTECDHKSNSRWAIKSEPDNAENKALWIEQYVSQGSFLYMTLKDENSELISVKDFELSFDFKLVRGHDLAGWLGFIVHKDIDQRYNGCNNILTAMRFWSADTISPLLMRNMGMTGIVETAKSADRSAEATPYYCESGTDVYSDWYTFKVVVENDELDMYVNDAHIGGMTISKNLFKKHGYISIVTCATESYIDNVRLVNKDTEAPPEVDDGGDDPIVLPTIEAPVLTGESTYTVNVGEKNALEIAVDTKGAPITKIEKGRFLLNSQYYTYEEGKLILTGDYISGLANKADSHEFTLTTEGGSVTFTLNVVGATNEKEGGCGSSVTGLGVVSVLTAMTAAVALKKRR